MTFNPRNQRRAAALDSASSCVIYIVELLCKFSVFLTCLEWILSNLFSIDIPPAAQKKRRQEKWHVKNIKSASFIHLSDFPRGHRASAGRRATWLCLYCELWTIPLIEIETARASLRWQKSDSYNLSALISCRIVRLNYSVILLLCCTLTQRGCFKAASRQNRVGSAAPFWILMAPSFPLWMCCRICCESMLLYCPLKMALLLWSPCLFFDLLRVKNLGHMCNWVKLHFSFFIKNYLEQDHIRLE